MVVGEGAQLSTGGISASRPRSRSRGSSPACCTASRRPIRCPSSSSTSRYQVRPPPRS